ncbi:hypothetical protein L7F22_066264 [Adiantum nelumboides]|nr:hypothetical protein [Adiantum nelumboides]
MVLLRINVMDRRSQRKDTRSSREIRDAESNRGSDPSPPRTHLGRVRHDSPESISLASGKRDDLDAMLREQIRWGDPMAHLVKKKVAEPVLVDLGVSDQVKESGFIVPQEIPTHSWLKRGIVPLPKRYAIRPGRHWDGVDHSTGYEMDMYKMQNEKKAEQVEAYLWSVADM